MSYFEESITETLEPEERIMAFEHMDNSGSIFKNQHKKEEKHPDNQGSCKIICPECGHAQEWRIAAWIKDLKDRSGRFFSLAFSIYEPKEKASPVVPDRDDFDDDIPF